jgi:polyhydroxybutyrate depolymerase
MKRILIVLAAASLLLSGCGLARPSDNPTGAVPTTTVHSITVDGIERTYVLTVPSGLPEHSPLVVMMHGGFGTGIQAERSYGWRELAASEGFVVAYPDGLDRAWNAGGCCGAPARQEIDDVAFITAMVAQIGESVPLDKSRIFATGMSNGAMMSFRMACDTSIFAAVAPVAGTIVDACDSPERASVLQIHGLADASVPFDGSPGTGVANVDGMPIPDVIALWQTVDDCTAPVVALDGPVTTSIATCAAGRAVELITVDGAGHQWPGSEQIREAADPPFPGLDATATIWAFFLAHPKP